jgi:hypothetical protein
MTAINNNTRFANVADGEELLKAKAARLVTGHSKAMK